MVMNRSKYSHFGSSQFTETGTLAHSKGTDALKQSSQVMAVLHLGLPFGDVLLKVAKVTKARAAGNMLCVEI